MAQTRSKKPTKAAKGSKSRKSLDTPASGTAMVVSSPASLPPLVPSTSPMPVSLAPIMAEAALQERQRKQKWTGLPPKSKIRKKAAQIMALKIEGHTNEEIAAIVGLAPRSLRQYLWIAAKNGWLTIHEPDEDVSLRLAHRAVSNLDELLHARDKDTGLPSQTITLETLKGTGIFRDHSSKGQAEAQVMPSMALQINIIAPDGAALPQMKAGSTFGTPAFIEGQVADGKG